MSIDEFLEFVKKNSSEILWQSRSPLRFCANLACSATRNKVEKEAERLLPQARDERDYAISSSYAVLIGSERRKSLSAYFTPPILAEAAVSAATAFIHSTTTRTLDPACGGGSFLGPMFRTLADREIRKGRPIEDACVHVLTNLRGIEIDKGLAQISNALLRARLGEDYGFQPSRDMNPVLQGDALTFELEKHFDLIIGNPPYGKIGKNTESLLSGAGLAANGGHTNLYSLFLLRALDWLKPGGGLVFVIPTSFVAGPYFAGLRQEILKRAEVVSIDLHEQRDNLFLGAVLDVCLLVLKRRDKNFISSLREQYQLGYIDAEGTRTSLGFALAPAGGEPWTLPVPGLANLLPRPGKPASIFTFADYGYRVKVGKVVPTRERNRLAHRRVKGSVPLLWASHVRPDGTFDFKQPQSKNAAIWYVPPTSKVDYAYRGPCVLVQRTSNRDQKRRLNAAPIDDEFLQMHRKRGFMAENHVIILQQLPNQHSVAPAIVAAVLNAASTNERFSAVSGSFSISSKLLGRLALPDPSDIPDLAHPLFDEKLKSAFAQLPSLIRPAPVSAPELNDTLGTPMTQQKLDRRVAVKQHA